MESITNQKGMLSLELGTSWISLNEAAALEKGDTIRLNSFTGIPHRLMFNNLFLGSCEIVILDDILGARITDFVRRPERASPGNKSSLTSLIPLAVRIGAASYFLEELEGLIPGSIISLDCPYRERTEAVSLRRRDQNGRRDSGKSLRKLRIKNRKNFVPPIGKARKGRSRICQPDYQSRNGKWFLPGIRFQTAR